MGRAMKESPFVWLGKIPAHWEVRKIKHYYQMQTGFTPDTKSDKFYDDSGEEWVTISDMEDGKVIVSTKKKISQIYIDEFKPPVTPPDSLLYSFKLSVGQTAYAGKPLYTNEAIASFLPSDNIDLHFLRYSSSLIVENAQVNIYNAKILNQNLIANAYIVFPPLQEQQIISTFLDSQCAKIDSIMEKTRTSVEEYKRLKQAVITRAVTKGVRGVRPMKESGIEWLKEIPSTWSTEKGKRLFVETNERSADGSEELLTVSHITGVTPRSQKNVNMFMAETLAGYKVCHVGDIAANTMWMWQGAIGVSMYHGVISPSYNTYRQSIGAYDPEYLDYLLRAKPLVGVYNAYSTGITISRLRLYPEQFFSIVFPVPTMDEQQEIAAYLDEKCAEIDALIAKKEQLLAELESYKKSMIYEYVTGKKEV